MKPIKMLHIKHPRPLNVTIRVDDSSRVSNVTVDGKRVVIGRPRAPWFTVPFVALVLLGLAWAGLLYLRIFEGTSFR